MVEKIGGSGPDKLVGTSGNDTLDGGDGNDWLDGGAGDDAFHFDANDGNDTIVSLDDGDKLIFDGEGPVDIELFIQHGAITFGETVVTVEHANTINVFAGSASSWLWFY